MTRINNLLAYLLLVGYVTVLTIPLVDARPEKKPLDRGTSRGSAVRPTSAVSASTEPDALQQTRYDKHLSIDDDDLTSSFHTGSSAEADDVANSDKDAELLGRNAMVTVQQLMLQNPSSFDGSDDLSRFFGLLRLVAASQHLNEQGQDVQLSKRSVLLPLSVSRRSETELDEIVQDDFDDLSNVDRRGGGSATSAGVGTRLNGGSAVSAAWDAYERILRQKYDNVDGHVSHGSGSSSARNRNPVRFIG